MLQSPKIHTDLLWWLTGLFVTLGLFFFIFVFLHRKKEARRNAHRAFIISELSPMISTFLFHEEDADVVEKSTFVHLKMAIRQLMSESGNRKIVTGIFLDLQKDLSGDTRNRLYRLYTDFELHLDAYRRLQSWRWPLVAGAILELTRMQVAEAYGFIKPFVHDKRGIIRKQAQIALVSLKAEGISYFLDTARYRISEWQQLKLLDVLRQKVDFIPPRFKQWLTSGNRDVVLFALRLMNYYKQNEAHVSIIELVKHRSDAVRLEALQAIREFHIERAAPLLKSVFWKSKTEVQLSILETLLSIGSMQDQDFFERVHTTSKNFSVQNKAISCLNTLFPDTVLPTKEIMPVSEEGHAPTRLKTPPEGPVQEPAAVPGDLVDDLAFREGQTGTDAVAPVLEDENLEIFEVCMWETLAELLAPPAEEEEDHPGPKVVNLAFLPVVDEKPTEATGDEMELSEINSRGPDPREQDVDPIEGDPDLKEAWQRLLFSILHGDEDAAGQEAGGEEGAPAESHSPGVLSTSLVGQGATAQLLDIPVTYETVDSKPGNLPDHALKPSTSETTGIEQEVAPAENDTTGQGHLHQSQFSIFEELFKGCDPETKLFLLDELYAVGDEKEICFLESLEADPDEGVRKKAEQIKEALTKALSEESMAPDEIGALDALDVSHWDFGPGPYPGYGLKPCDELRQAPDGEENPSAPPFAPIADGLPDISEARADEQELLHFDFEPGIQAPGPASEAQRITVREPREIKRPGYCLGLAEILNKVRGFHG